MSVITIRPAPPPTEDEYKAAIVALLDAAAVERRYDNGLSFSTYATSTDPAWAAEAAAFVDWRDRVWKYCYAQLYLVTTGQRPQPTVAAFLAELPTPVWPE